MKKYGYLLLLLIMQSNSSFAVEIFSRFKKSSPAQKIDEIQMSAKKLLLELQGLKQCQAAKSCTKVQYDRIKQLGKRIGAATLVLVGAAFLTGIGIGARKESMKPTVANAAREKEVDLKKPEDKRMLEAFASNSSHKISEVAQDAFDNPTKYTNNAVRGAYWLAKQNNNKYGMDWAQAINDKQLGIEE